MNDTVTKILDLVGEYAKHYAEDRRWGTFTADTTKARQALQDELVRLFTPQDLAVGLAIHMEEHGITGGRDEI